MPACKPVPLLLALLLLVYAPLLDTRMAPGRDLQLRDSEIGLAHIVSAMPVRLDDIPQRPLDGVEAAPEVTPNLDSVPSLADEDRRNAIRERAVRLLHRFEAEIAWRFGRVAAR